MNSIKFSFLSLLIFAASFSYAANTDSLEQVLPSLKGVEKIQTLSDLCYYLSFSDVDKSEKYGQAGLKAALAHGDSTLIANSYNDLSILYTLKANYKKGLEYNLKAYEIRKNLNAPEKLISSLSKIGVCYSELGEFEKASKYILEAISIVEENKLEEKYYLVYDNLGGLYKEMKKFEVALSYHQKAYDYAIKTSNNYATYTILINIAGSYRNLGRIEESIDLHLQAVEFLKETEDLRSKALVFSNLSSLYSGNKEFKKAISYAKLALPIYKEIENYDGLSLINNNIAYYYIDNNAIKVSNQNLIENHLKEAHKYAIMCNSQIRISQNYDAFSRYYKHIKKYELALSYKEKFDNITDTIFSLENNKIVEELRAEYETEKKEKEIAEQKNLIAEEQLKVKQRNYTLLGFGLVFIFVVTFSFFIYKQQQQKQQQLIEENKLKDQLASAELQNKLHQERLRISADLHDNIGSQLTFIISSVDNMKYLFKTADEKLTDKLNNISSFTRTTITQLRDTIWALNKDEISFTDLYARLQNYISSAQLTQDQTAFTINNTSTTNFHLNSIQGVCIYRIIQEALNNSIKYAAAASISLHISETKEAIVITLKDDGIGFKMADIVLGNGLENMKNRAETIAAEFNIESAPAKGTVITLTLKKDTLNAV